LSAAFVHPTAVVDPGAVIGEDTKIWHFCHVMPGAVIGARCSFGQGCYVAGRVVVGNDVKVQNNVSLYDLVTIDDEVFIGPSAVFTNVVTPRSAFPRKDAFAPTRVHRGASIGANATIVCGHDVGEAALVAAGAVVTHDVPPFAIVAGVPARVIGHACRCGERLEPTAEPTCRACGRRYRTAPGGLEAAG
jgi:UDP-2-acetamido-3-amino-2,3-dideoxy-glucuronate N-acetyltransferase